MDQVAENKELVGPIRTMTLAKLLKFDVSEKGEEIPSVGGQLLKIPGLEETTWRAPMGLITTNPDQPRSYFRPEKMQELEQSIRAKGQKVAAKVAPYIDLNSGEVRLFLVDGERRFRVMQSIPAVTIKVEICSVLTLEELFEDSLLINEGRDPHNPIERARAYRRLIDYKEKRGEKAPIQETARKLAVSDQTIYNYLRLLELPEEIQALVARDQVPASELFHLAHAKKKFGDKLDLLKVARILLDSLHKDVPASVSPKGITAKGVREAARQALLEGGNEAQAIELESQQSVYQLLNGLNGVLRAGENFTREKNRTELVRILRKRKSPPEVLRDRIQDVLQKLQEMVEIVDVAIKPDPLPEIPGKPKFTNFIREKTTRRFGNSETRYKLALAIARSSDEKDIVSTTELVEFLKSDVNTVASNLRILEDELRESGLKLEQHTIREKDSRDHYDKKVAYRLAWILSSSVGSEPTKVERPVDPTPVTKLPILSPVSSRVVRRPAQPEPQHSGSQPRPEIASKVRGTVVTSAPVVTRPAPQVPYKKPQTVVTQKHNKGLAVFIPKQPKKFPAARAVPILMPDEKMKKAKFKGEKRSVRQHNIIDIYKPVAGEEVVVLDKTDQHYDGLAKELMLSAKEVIVILVNKDNAVSKVHPVFLELRPPKPSVESKMFPLEPEVSKVSADTVQPVPPASSGNGQSIQREVTNPEERVANSESCPILSMNEMDIGKTVKERVKDLRIRKRQWVKRDTNGYYGVLRGEEVVVMPRDHKDYDLFAHLLNVQKGELIVILVSIQNSLSKVTPNLLSDTSS